MIREVDHVAIVVSSLDKALKFYRDILNLHIENIELIEDQGVKVAMVVMESCHIELLEPISRESPVAKFLEKRGEGIHHIALSVSKDLDEYVEELKAKGVHLIYGKSRIGAEGGKINFCHPRSTRGVLIELCEAVDSQEKGDAEHGKR